MLPQNGPQDRPSVRLHRARTHLCPSCSSGSSSSTGRDVRGVRKARCPGSVHPCSPPHPGAFGELRVEEGGRRVGGPVARPRLQGWCWVLGARPDPTLRLFMGDGRLQQPDSKGRLPLDLSRWAHSSGTTPATLGRVCLAQLRAGTQSQVTPSALHGGNTTKDNDADKTHLPSRHTVLPAVPHRLESRGLQSAPVQASVEMLASHCESGTAYPHLLGLG